MMKSNDGDLLRQLRSEAVNLFHVAVKRVDPYEAVKAFVRLEGESLILGEENRPKTELNLGKFSRIFMVGGGKATAPMAKAMEDLLGDRITQGIINDKYGFTEELSYTVFLTGIGIYQCFHRIF